MKWPFRRGEPACDQFVRAVEEDEADILASVREDVAIGALQRRAGDHEPLAFPGDAVDLVGDGLQPGPAIVVGERMAGAHLRDIAWRVKAVAVLKAPAKPRRQSIGDGAFARAGDAHHASVRREGAYHPRKFSGSAALSTSQIVSPIERARFAGRFSPASRRVKIARFSATRRPRTAFRGRKRVSAGSARREARRGRHSPWARRSPSDRFHRSPDNRETIEAVWPSGPTPISTRSNSGRAGSSSSAP